MDESERLERKSSRVGVLSLFKVGWTPLTFLFFFRVQHSTLKRGLAHNDILPMKRFERERREECQSCARQRTPMKRRRWRRRTSRVIFRWLHLVHSFYLPTKGYSRCLFSLKDWLSAASSRPEGLTSRFLMRTKIRSGIETNSPRETSILSPIFGSHPTTNHACFKKEEVKRWWLVVNLWSFDWWSPEATLVGLGLMPRRGWTGKSNHQPTTSLETHLKTLQRCPQLSSWGWSNAEC